MRIGRAFLVKDGEISHLLEVIPIIPKGWMIFKDNTPAYGGIVWRTYLEAMEIIERIENILKTRGCSKLDGPTLQNRYCVIELDRNIKPIPAPEGSVQIVEVKEGRKTIREVKEVKKYRGCQLEDKKEEPPLRVRSVLP